MKLLKQKAYGSIPHLPSSRIGQTDKYVSEGQALIATKQLRDRYDIVVIQEKLDGSCCAVAKIDGVIHPLTRSGNLACQSQFAHLQLFYRWAMERADKFNALLREGERLVGEWLALAHGTKYLMLTNEEVFRAFDLMTDHTRLCYEEFMNRVAGKFETAPLLSYGLPHTPEYLQDHFPISGAGAESVEGYIWRVERKRKVDFLCKWVKPDYISGKYLPEFSGQPSIWNWQP